MAVDGTEGYEFKRRLDDQVGGFAATCDKENCSFGLYEKVVHHGELPGDREIWSGPGCTSCGVMAVELSSVFDANEPRYLGPVPDEFRVAAAICIVRSSNLARAMTPGTELHAVKIMSWGRPEALREILKVARAAGVEYDGDDLPKAVLKDRD